MANLVFKFNWDHRPFQLNSAQGKRQFMLPFASGIPNLTPNWTQVTGLGTAATGTLTTSTLDSTVGRVTRVGDFGVGALSPVLTAGESDAYKKNGFFRVIDSNTAHALYAGFGLSIFSQSTIQGFQLFQAMSGPKMAQLQYRNCVNDVWSAAQSIYSTANTTVDANGFIKSASPIVQLFANKILLNEDASKQEIEYEKLGVGNYLIKGSLGFAKEGWYIEVPKDANGNNIVAVVYKTLENGDISIKTFKRKFDFEIAAVVADLENPMDIPEGRWIDIRLYEEPIPEYEEPLTETPIMFQPTNLSEAVAAAMIGLEPPEVSESDETK